MIRFLPIEQSQVGDKGRALPSAYPKVLSAWR